MFQMGKHPPARPQAAAHPKAAKPKAARRTGVTVHLDAAEREQFEALGGDAWLREQLKRARPSPG